LRSNQSSEDNTGINQKNKSKAKKKKKSKVAKQVEEINTVQDSASEDIERDVLNENPNSNLQIQVDNIELGNDVEVEPDNNTEPNNIDIEQNVEELAKRSFIWNYLEKLPPSAKYKRRAKCLVLVNNQLCGHIMGSDGSTGNFINHLAAKHNITRDTNLSLQNNEDNNEYEDMNNIKKNRLDEKFVGIIIKDNQPLSIRNDEGLQEFVKELNPSYELPSDKKIKKLLIKSYNYCKQKIVHLFEKNIISCSLTLDLWTSRSRAGYLGVTCSFVDAQFELHEATLAIKYLKYPHTSKSIIECLNQIIQEWNLDEKVFTITTDNGRNMVKAGELLNIDKSIIRFPCAAHTLQLVVGKGLFPAERLVARAKRLINFFTTPKQTERLIDIQKNMNFNQQEVNLIII
jgi:hypothetical protein